jgi:soluble lytic murein transglycosylase-like protein
MKNPPQHLRQLADHFRDHFGLFEGNQWNLDPKRLMYAWIEQESSWNPHAVREERGFYRNYILPNVGDRRVAREQWARATSWGLLQIMGQVAREQGFRSKYLPELLIPEVNLYHGSQFLAEDRKPRTDGTWAGALAAYNGGLGGNREPPYRRQEYVDDIVRRAQRWHSHS